MISNSQFRCYVKSNQIKFCKFEMRDNVKLLLKIYFRLRPDLYKCCKGEGGGYVSVKDITYFCVSCATAYSYYGYSERKRIGCSIFG